VRESADLDGSLIGADAAGSVAMGAGGVSLVLAEGISFIDGPLGGLVSSVLAQPFTINAAAKIDIMTGIRISMPTSL
jgi:hypothetical protein